jgi:hypothetical protein
MKRLTILATTLAFVVLGTACKKDEAKADHAGAAGSASAGGLASGAAKQSPPPETGLKFGKKALAVGAKRSESSISDMAMKLAMAGKVNEMQMTESGKKDEEILEVANNAIMKLKVTYTEDSKSMGEGGQPAKAKPSPLVGKTYIVASKDGKVVVLTDKEKPAPKAEASLVEKQYKSLGKPDPMLAAMPDRALKDGEDVPELAAAITQSMKDHDDKTKLEGAKITFKKKDGDNGIFDVAMTIKSDDGPFKMSVPLKGTVTMRVADGWPSTLELSGPLSFDLSDKDKKSGVEASGSLKLNSTYSYK